MGWAGRNSLTELGKGIQRGSVSTMAPVLVRLLACAGSRWSWRRQRCTDAERSRRRLEDLVDVGVLEELEKADNAQVQEEAGGDLVDVGAS